MEHVVDDYEINQLKDENNFCGYTDTSAKEDIGIDKVFYEMGEILNKTKGGNKMIMKHILRKTLAVCLIGLGLGILLVLLLPITGWLFIIGVAVVCVGFAWLAC